MPVSIEELRPHLQAFDFSSSFRGRLGVGPLSSGEPFVVARKRATTIPAQAHCGKGWVRRLTSAIPDVDNNDTLQYPVRRKIESEVAKRTFEHLIIFVPTPAALIQIWQWVKRDAGKPADLQRAVHILRRAVRCSR